MSRIPSDSGIHHPGDPAGSVAGIPRSHPDTDTLQIWVKAKEKVVNYDSLFRELPSGRSEPATSPHPDRTGAPASGKEVPERPAGVPVRQTTGNPHTARPEAAGNGASHSDLAARGIMTAGLALILIGVVLELFMKRNGMAFLATGVAVVLAGLIML